MKAITVRRSTSQPF